MTGLHDKAALITGGTGGIGRAIAERLAGDGALVVITGRDAARGAEVVERVRAGGGRAEFVEAELGTGASARTLASAASAAAGGAIDILVNNAAFILPGQSMMDTTEAQIDTMLAVNVKAPYLLTAAIVPGMIARGSGTVINIGSISGAFGFAPGALYAASKAALHSLTQCWAAELGPQGVRVNAVLPGPTTTELNGDLAPLIAQWVASYPSRRANTADELAAAVAFLAGDQAANIHGVLLPVDGGALTR